MGFVDYLPETPGMFALIVERSPSLQLDTYKGLITICDVKELT